MDVNKLLQALDNENHESLFNFNTKKIKEMNLNILRELQLPNNLLIDFFKKLDGYKYVDEINDLKIGVFIRWIPISDPTKIVLKNGAFISDVKITDDGVYILCKYFGKKYSQFKMDECLIFQKLTDQEKIILSALDHLSK